MNTPFVTIVMPIRNEGEFIQRSLGAVLAQDYPTQCMEILVVDGMSDDGTREYVARLAKTNDNLYVIDNPNRTVPYALNRAIRQARGDIIIRVDGHTIIEPDYIGQCVVALRDTEADNVGGRMNAKGETAFGEVVALATSSKFGVGGARFHYSQNGEWVDTVYLGAWPKSVFERIGLFDEEMVRNQDDEFNYRLRASGGRIWLSPKICSTYTPRGNWRRFWRQYYQYGFWKVRVLQKHPRQMRLHQFVPLTFLLSLILAALLPIGWSLVSLILLTYAAADLLASVKIARQSGWKYLPGLLLTHPTMHVAYGLGFLVGLVRFAGRWGDRAGTVPHYKDSISGDTPDNAAIEI